MAASTSYFLPESLRVFSDQIEHVHNILNIKGKVLLLLRGLPGCGKTTLGNTIISMLGMGKMFSADDYFYCNGQYIYRPQEISTAHAVCQKSVKNAIQSMESLIIVANTNLEKWQMVPYANMAASHGYYLLLMIPNTPWHKDVARLARLNTHGISKHKLYDLRDRFERVKSSDLLIQNPLEIPKDPASLQLTNMSHLTQESNNNAPGPSSPRGSAPLPQRDQRRRPKPQGNHLTRKDAALLFETVRLSGNLGKWGSAEPKDGRCTPPKTPGNTPVDSPRQPEVPKMETSTSITDLDLVFLSEEACDADLALDLAYRVLLVRGTWEGAQKEEEEEIPGPHKACQTGNHVVVDEGEQKASDLDTKARDERKARMNHSKSPLAERKADSSDVEPPSRSKAHVGTCISELDHVFFTEEPWDSLALDLGFRLVLANGTWKEEEKEEEERETPGPHKACQTQEDIAPPVPEGLRALCSIFPHAQDSDLADLLRVTGGDVEWAVDVFLQSGYADGLSCERPAATAPCGDSASTSSSDPLSPALSSLELSEETPEAEEPQPEAEEQQQEDAEEEEAPRLSLDRVFLRNAHRKFGAEFAVDSLNVECLPDELLEKWELPESLARAIYASYLEHLGQIERADSKTAVEAVCPAAPLGGRPQTGISAQGVRAPPVLSNNVRDIMEEEEQMARVYADRRKDLMTDTASVLKLNRLTKAFPNLERQELMDIFISFQHREDWTRAHLLSLGHVTVEAAEESGEAAACAEAGVGAVAENKQELMKEKARLMARKAHLQEQLRKVAGQRDLMAAAGFYVGEIYAVDKSLASLCERLREVRLSEQAADLLDLHHFSVAEALSGLKQRLAECRTERRRQLLVLTGVGRHSRGKAKLRPAVRQFLQQSHFKFEEIYRGAFRINV